MQFFHLLNSEFLLTPTKLLFNVIVFVVRKVNRNRRWNIDTIDTYILFCLNFPYSLPFFNHKSFYFISIFNSYQWHASSCDHHLTHLNLSNPWKISSTMYDLATTVDTLRQLYFAKNIDNLLVQLILVGPTDTICWYN